MIDYLDKSDFGAVVTILEPNSSLVELTEALAHTPLRACVIVESERLIAVVTQGDFLRFLNSHSDYSEYSVLDVVHANGLQNPIVVSSISEGIKVLNLAGVSIVCVVGLDGHLQGAVIGQVQRWSGKLRNAKLHGLILAGGRGERLRPLTDNCPKPLLKIRDCRIIDYVLSSMEVAGIEDITISVNYLKDLFFREKFRQEVAFLDEEVPLGTGGPVVKYLKAYMERSSSRAEESVLVVANGDLYCHFGSSLISSFLSSGLDSAVCFVEVSEVLQFGVVEECSEIPEKVMITERPELRLKKNSGVYLFKVNGDLVDAIANIEGSVDMPDLFNMIGDMNFSTGALELPGEWVDMGTKDDFLRVGGVIGNG